MVGMSVCQYVLVSHGSLHSLQAESLKYDLGIWEHLKSLAEAVRTVAQHVELTNCIISAWSLKPKMCNFFSAQVAKVEADQGTQANQDFILRGTVVACGSRMLHI